MMRIFVNKSKSIFAAVVFLFFGGYGIYYLTDKSWLPAVVFLTLAVLFGLVLARYASVLCVDETGMQLKLAGFVRREMPWSEVREIGLIGEDVFHRSRERNDPERSPKKIHTGDKYIYFSPARLTADERFAMIVKWPPKDKLYAEYSERALAYIMTLWDGKLETYNVEDIYPNTAEPTGGKWNGK